VLEKKEILMNERETSPPSGGVETISVGVALLLKIEEQWGEKKINR